MKSVISAIAMALVVFAAPAVYAQDILTLDAALACTDGVVNTHAVVALNVYTSAFGMQVRSLKVDQVLLDGNNVVLQNSSGPKIVLGTLLQTPSCTFDYDKNTYAPATWVNVKKSAGVQMKLQIQPDAKTCTAYAGAVGGYLRTNHMGLQVGENTTLIHFEWDEQSYLPTLAACQAAR